MHEILPFSKTDINRWTENIPTPFYVYDAEGIRNTVRELQKAFAWNEGFREYFAVKATPTPGILRLMRELGCGCDCASVPELMLSERSGISGECIMFSSNETTRAEYQAAARLGAIINLDDTTQISIMEDACGIPDTVCCRYNPGIFHITNDIMGRLYDSKFGMTKRQLFDSYSVLKDKGVRHFGLHAMLASCSLDNEYYPRLAEELFDLVKEIYDELGIVIEFVDMSGGIGIPYLPSERPVDIGLIGEKVHEVYEHAFSSNNLRPRIYTEMGRYITGPHGYLLTSVIGFKHIYKEYVGVDATACDLMRPAMYGAYHHISVPGREGETHVKKRIVDVVGSLCENNDKFAVERELPRLSYRDVLVIQDAGAHGHAMGYNYNGKLKCAEYLMEADRSLKMIRRAQRPEDYFSTLDIDEEFTAVKGSLQGQ